MPDTAPQARDDAPDAEDVGAEDIGPVQIYEPLEAQPPAEPVEAPDSEADVELDSRAPTVMPMVWLVLGVCAVALFVAFVFMSRNPPHRTPAFQAATPVAPAESS